MLSVRGILELIRHFRVRERFTLVHSHITSHFRTIKVFKNMGRFVPKKMFINTRVKMPIGFTNITSSTARTRKLVYNTRFKRLGNKIFRTKHTVWMERINLIHLNLCNYFKTEIPMFLNILIVLGIFETVVMPPVFKLLIWRLSHNLKSRRVFILNKQVEHVNLSLHFKMYLFRLSGFSLLFFSKYLLVSLKKFAFYVNLNLWRLIV